MSLKPLLEAWQSRVESLLHSHLPDPDTAPKRLHQAIRYSTLDGGKRVRPVLVYATGQAVGADPEHLDIPACAVELIHAYSLIHDDLPAMDDDDLRRGKPTCHKAFDEATAILAGDGMQTLAFELLSEAPGLDDGQRIAMLKTLSHAAGNAGMVGGQALDIDATGQQLDLQQLERMHRLKTGALISASVRLGALARPGIEQRTLDALQHYAEAIGLAFQVQDDILDVTADTETLGKPQGSDAAHHKATYTQLLGLEGAREKAHLLHQEALHVLEGFDERADPLRWLADYIVNRTH